MKVDQVVKLISKRTFRNQSSLQVAHERQHRRCNCFIIRSIYWAFPFGTVVLSSDSSLKFKQYIRKPIGQVPSTAATLARYKKPPATYVSKSSRSPLSHFQSSSLSPRNPFSLISSSEEEKSFYWDSPPYMSNFEELNASFGKTTRWGLLLFSRPRD